MSMHSDDMSPDEEARLAFLRDEGLELLALYKMIRNPKDRDKVQALARSLVETSEIADDPAASS